MRKLVILLSFAFTAFTSSAQEKIDDKDGVNFTYSLTKLKEDVKFVYYTVNVKATNTNDFDLFYQGPKNKVNPFFATIGENHSKTSFYFEGVASRLSLGDIPLYYLKSKSSFSSSKDFKIKKELTPFFKIEYSNTFYKIDDLK